MHSWDVLYCTLRKKSGEREGGGGGKREAEKAGLSRGQTLLSVACTEGWRAGGTAEDRLASSAVGVLPEVLAATPTPGVHLG